MTRTRDWRDSAVGKLLFALLAAALWVLMPRFHTWWHWLVGAALLGLMSYLTWPVVRRIFSQND